MKKAYLVLQNGKVFEGQAIGAEGIALGEMVFTTGVIGYIENLTDPCYAGQIVMQTFPVVGNYGVASEDVSGKCTPAGFVVRELCDEPSNFRSAYDLDKLLKDNGIVGLCGVDTREITTILRDEGVMNAAICSEIPADMTALNNYRVELPANIGNSERMTVNAAGEKKYSVALIDCGAGMKLANVLSGFGCEVTLLPYDADASEILGKGYDGVAISEGPGDPAGYKGIISAVNSILGKLPLFGVGLGHQIAAIAAGDETYKLKYGHRGSNQPVKCIENGRVYITSQNHGYAVRPTDPMSVIFTNVNDGSCEGIYSAEKKLISAQFMPEICVGPNDMRFVYERFAEMMGGNRNAQR